MGSSAEEPPGLSRGKNASSRGLVAGGKDGARNLERFGQTAPHRGESECRHVLFGSDREARGLARELIAAVKAEPGFLQELSGEAQVFGAVHAPEPQLFFIPLEEVQTLFELFHGAVKGAGQEIDAKRPSMAGIVHLNTDAILASLIAFHAAAVVVTSGLSAVCHCVHQSERYENQRVRELQRKPRTNLPAAARKTADWPPDRVWTGPNCLYRRHP